MGYYYTGHRDRLRMIAHLQERGFSLAAIKEALGHWTEVRSLAHLLGVSYVAPGLLHKPTRMSPEEFAEGVGDHPARHPAGGSDRPGRTGRRRVADLQRSFPRSRRRRSKTGNPPSQRSSRSTRPS